MEITAKHYLVTNTITMKLYKIIILSGLMGFGRQSYSQSVSVAKLPLYNKEQVSSKTDWLIKSGNTKSVIYKTPEGYLAFSNGLITRTFSVTPNGATIGLDNLTTNEALVRSVSPEAVIWINGQEIKVGGLTGQPIQNYLLPEWLPAMKADPASLKLFDITSGPIKERMEWNRRMSWLSQPIAWPPKGQELVFSYKADNFMIDHFKNEQFADLQRKVIQDDKFLRMSPNWKLVSGTGEIKMTFHNEGKAGEMLGAAENVAYGEQKLPADTRVIICKLNSGTDNSTQYGPGIALTFSDGNNVKFYLSPGNQKFGLNYKGEIKLFPDYRPDKAYFLRIEIGTKELICGISEDGKQYKTLTTVAVPGKPVDLRIGKTDPQGNNKAGSLAGSFGRSKIESVTLLGDKDQANDKLGFLKNLTVKVHYELYDGLPLLSKWVTVENDSDQEIVVNNIESEHLAVVESESAVEAKQRWELPPIFAQSDFAFGSMSPNASENACVSWQQDSNYTTQVNYALTTPTVLQCKPRVGIGQEVSKGKPFESMRLWELIYDSSDRERRGLAQRKMYRTIAPWITENPVIMHVSSSADDAVKKAIDQSAEVGFEMVIMTFGSGFNAEDTTSANLDRMKRLEDYAKSKGIAVGGYSLLASRSIDKKNDVVMPSPEMKAIFGNSPCLLSNWGNDYFNKLYNFYGKTGQDLLEHDGSYPGDICASTDHPGHNGLEDSQWKQFVKIRDYYRWSRSKGIYLNVPDWYFLSGSNKIAMGYRETNWSLPRANQEIIERQNIYDGTWEKAPSMGWMFVPLVQYHGGGAAATIEPLKEHLPHYGQRLANLFGAGVQACYRGPQLYDSPETKVVVSKWVNFYKKHRRILDSDIVHLRRPDGRDYDAILHTDPAGTEKGLLMIYNPLNEAITRTLTVDLYYTGLKGKAVVSEQDGVAKVVALDGSKLTIQVKIPANSQTWYVLK